MPEADLYDPVQNYLDLVFSKRLKPLYGNFRHLTAITANAGGNTTGIWSKPDLCMVALNRRKYDFNWQLDLHGFEVKPFATCNAQSVHEALNHTSLVHYTHLVWHCERWDDRDEKCSLLLERCSHFGVGFITFSNPEEQQSYTVRLPSRRHSPEPDAIDEFIETRLTESDRQTLFRWIEELR